MCGELNDSGCDLFFVKDAEQLLSRAQTATLRPSQQQQQTGQGLELQLQQVFQLTEFLVFNQVKCSNLQEEPSFITLLDFISCCWFTRPSRYSMHYKNNTTEATLCALFITSWRNLYLVTKLVLPVSSYLRTKTCSRKCFPLLRHSK